MQFQDNTLSCFCADKLRTTSPFPQPRKQLVQETSFCCMCVKSIIKYFFLLSRCSVSRQRWIDSELMWLYLQERKWKRISRVGGAVCVWERKRPEIEVKGRNQHHGGRNEFWHLNAKMWLSHRQEGAKREETYNYKFPFCCICLLFPPQTLSCWGSEDVCCACCAGESTCSGVCWCLLSFINRASCTAETQCDTLDIFAVKVIQIMAVLQPHKNVNSLKSAPLNWIHWVRQ